MLRGGINNEDAGERWRRGKSEQIRGIEEPQKGLRRVLLIGERRKKGRERVSATGR